MPNLRILIADDNAELRKSVRMMLAFEKDIEVVAVARDGQEAIEMAQRFQPDVAVLDINMPRKDGLSVIRDLSQLCPQTVCLIMSSEGERDLMRQAMSMGVRDYLVKPFTPEEFVQATRRAAQQALDVRHKVETARQAEAEREKFLNELVMSYLKTGRMDDQAARAYAEYAQRPQAEPATLARLAEIFCARRDWHTLRLICERMEKLEQGPRGR